VVDRHRLKILFIFIFLAQFLYGGQTRPAVRTAIGPPAIQRDFFLRFNRFVLRRLEPAIKIQIRPLVTDTILPAARSRQRRHVGTQRPGHGAHSYGTDRCQEADRNKNLHA
jgi:hypothetical protein